MWIVDAARGRQECHQPQEGCATGRCAIAVIVRRSRAQILGSGNPKSTSASRRAAVLLTRSGCSHCAEDSGGVCKADSLTRAATRRPVARRRRLCLTVVATAAASHRIALPTVAAVALGAPLERHVGRRNAPKPAGAPAAVMRKFLPASSFQPSRVRIDTDHTTCTPLHTRSDQPHAPKHSSNFTVQAPMARSAILTVRLA